MKVFSVLLFTLILAALFAIAAYQPQPPTAGNLAPAFTLPNQEGVQVSLDQFKGKWVVLYFYPKDFSSGCTVEAHNFQRDIDKYTGKSAVIIGVSVDTVDSHKSFCTKEGFNFKLLADASHAVAQKYGSIMEYNGIILAARQHLLDRSHGRNQKGVSEGQPAGS